MHAALFQLHARLHHGRQLVTQSLEASSQVMVDLAELMEVLLQAVGELVLMKHRQRCLGLRLWTPLVRSVLALYSTSTLGRPSWSITALRMMVLCKELSLLLQSCIRQMGGRLSHVVVDLGRHGQVVASWQRVRLDLLGKARLEGHLNVESAFSLRDVVSLDALEVDDVR